MNMFHKYSTSEFLSGWIPPTFLAASCALILGGILVAGLWPFHQPKNGVTWLQGANGVRLGRHGTLITPGILNSSSKDEAWSLEIWLQPSKTDTSSTLLAFYRPENPEPFSLRQDYTDLVLQASHPDAQHRTKNYYVENAFREGRQKFITIASGRHGTVVYLDGILAKTYPQLQLPGRTLSARLVVGTSPIQNDSWTGSFRGLAIYGQELSAAQVVRHYQEWTTLGRPDLADGAHVDTLYLFNEHTGNVVHNLGRSGIELHIPEKYMILNEKFLEPPWREFSLRWGYWKDALINIGGFIPFGFFFFALLSLVRPISRPALVTVLLGATVSLTIEVLQSYLPTRDSGMTDLITNTLGTGLGVMLHDCKLIQRLVAKVFLRVALTASGYRRDHELSHR
jgi:hypothetical protein